MSLIGKLRGLPGKLARLARSLSVAQARPDDAWALAFLTPAEALVYRDMDPRDREHACRVARHLQRHHPEVPEEVLAAALLHDCGKSVRPYRVWERVAVGLVPYRTARHLPFGALTVRFQHPQIGAGRLREVGARERVVALVERHHAPGTDAQAALLHAYDDRE